MQANIPVVLDHERTSLSMCNLDIGFIKDYLVLQKIRLDNIKTATSNFYQLNFI